MIWNSHGSWESDILWQLHSQKAALHKVLLWLQLWTFLLLNIHLSLWVIRLIFIAPFVSVVRDQLWVELIIIIGSYEMMKKFTNTQKNGGMWRPWRITNPFLTNTALVTLAVATAILETSSPISCWSHALQLWDSNPCTFLADTAATPIPPTPTFSHNFVTIDKNDATSNDMNRTQVK